MARFAGVPVPADSPARDQVVSARWRLAFLDPRGPWLRLLQRDDRFGRFQRRAATLNRQLGGWATWDRPPPKPNGCVGKPMRGNASAGSE